MNYGECLPKTVILTGGAFPPIKATTTTGTLWVMKEATFTNATPFTPTHRNRNYFWVFSLKIFLIFKITKINSLCEDNEDSVASKGSNLGSIEP
jgi:hypothetical protein